MNVKDFAVGQAVESVHMLLEKASEAKTKAEKIYWKLTLRDKSGSIEGRLWDYNAGTMPPIQEGNVYIIWGQVEEFAGQLQINVKDIQNSTEPLGNFARSTQFNVDVMWSRIVNTVAEFSEPLTKYVVEELLIKQAAIADAFKKAPAARGVHNAWYGGLLEHTESMLEMSLLLIGQYRRYCPEISADKVQFGIIMHDLGKIVEYDYSNPAFKSTPVGMLTNHLVLGPAWIYEQCNKWYKLDSGPGGQPQSQMNPDKFRMERAQLMHIVAAHHGELEWGSPVRPATIEALLVHAIDKLDSDMMHAVDLVNGKPGQIPGFSEKSTIQKGPFLQYNKG